MLILTGVPASYDGYQFRVELTNTGSCTVYSNTVTLTVSNDLHAVNDDFSNNQVSSNGGVAGDVTLNDLMNGMPVNDDAINISIVSDSGLTGVSVNSTGKIQVPAGINAATYTLVYNICDVLKPDNCSAAKAIVVVTSTNSIQERGKSEQHHHLS